MLSWTGAGFVPLILKDGNTGLQIPIWDGAHGALRADGHKVGLALPC